MQRHTQLFDDERSERQDVQKWHLLLQRMMEACHFVLFLADHQLRDGLRELLFHADDHAHGRATSSDAHETDDAAFGRVVVLASGDLTADGALPQDTTVWILLD